MPDPRYTVTIYTAAPGTPLYNSGTPLRDEAGNAQSSVPGHMYFVTSDGVNRKSYGFAPIKPGSVNSPGATTHADEDGNHNPLYARTMEVSKAQYDKLNEFGKAPEKFGFDLYYRDARNNCVDFTWAGLNHAGIKRTEKSLWDGKDHEVDGKLNYLPARNDESIKTIRDPVPGSPLNKEQRHPMPQLQWWQRVLTEDEQRPPGSPGAPSVASTEDLFAQLARAAASGDDKAFSAAAQSHLQSADGQALMAAGRQAYEAQEIQRQQELASVQPMEPAVPQMRVRS